MPPRMNKLQIVSTLIGLAALAACGSVADELATDEAALRICDVPDIPEVQDFRCRYDTVDWTPTMEVVEGDVRYCLFECECEYELRDSAECDPGTPASGVPQGECEATKARTPALRTQILQRGDSCGVTKDDWKQCNTLCKDQEVNERVSLTCCVPPDDDERRLPVRTLTPVERAETDLARTSGE